MNRLFLTVGLALMVILAVSCGGSTNSKLVGTWKVKNVETDFDETKVTPEMLSQVVDMQKQTYFRILNDTAMVIISNRNTHEAKWSFDANDQSLTYFFKGNGSKANPLGKLVGESIVSETKTAMGVMTIYYEKE